MDTQLDALRGEMHRLFILGDATFRQMVSLLSMRFAVPTGNPSRRAHLFADGCRCMDYWRIASNTHSEVPIRAFGNCWR